MLRSDINNLYDTFSFRSLWVHYSLKKKSEKQYTEKYKFHISIDQKKIYQAQAIVLDILSRHLVHSFKLLYKPHKPQNYRNSQGKELVIYIQHDLIDPNNEISYEADPLFWTKVLTELENSLEQNGVLPNQNFKPQGDKLLKGSKGYIYFRYTTNIFGNYVEADQLRFSGFTSAEAYNLSGELDFEEWLNRLNLHTAYSFTQQDNMTTSKKVDIPDFTKLTDYSFNKQDKKLIKQSFVSDTFHESTPKIFFKDEQYDKNDIHEKEIQLLKSIFKKLWLIQEENYSEDNDILVKFLDECLNEAAEYCAILRKVLNMPTGLFTKYGMIIPILYHHFIVPITKAMFFSQEIDPKKLIDKQKFVVLLTKCSFRNREIKQIEFNEPQYEKVVFR